TPWARANNSDEIFPARARDNGWFERIPIEIHEDLRDRNALMIARAEAYPEGFVPSPKQWVWTAGVQSGMRLAKQGVWVPVSYEGVGESEPTGLESLTGPITWTKLSHLRGYVPSHMAFVATYQLLAKKDHPDLRGKTHFFWMSSTSFERARQLFPGEV